MSDIRFTRVRPEVEEGELFVRQLNYKEFIEYQQALGHPTDEQLFELVLSLLDRWGYVVEDPENTAWGFHEDWLMLRTITTENP